MGSPPGALFSFYCERNCHQVNQLERLHHILSGRLVFLEMRCLQVRLVSGLAYTSSTITWVGFSFSYTAFRASTLGSTRTAVSMPFFKAALYCESYAASTTMPATRTIWPACWAAAGCQHSHASTPTPKMESSLRRKF